MKNYFLSVIVSLLLVQNAIAQPSNLNLALPNASQLVWQDAEMGALISYDLPVFQGRPYNQAENRITPISDANIFDPKELNTDQWILAAKSAGSKFAVLTVTHETGFALYQSDVNPYCMKAIKFQDGKGDIVRDFVNSCRKYGILPGLFVGIRWNSFFGVHDYKVAGNDEFAKNRQHFYKKMCEGMVKELCTRYGDLFMIWFDGGADDPNKDGADILPIVQKYQPNCLFYHNAQRADFRWGGSESGTVPYPCWATFPFPFSHSAKQKIVFANDFFLLKHGDEDGKYWMPAMSDAPLRGYDGGHDWFWNSNEDNHIFPLKNLMDMYRNSVGHNSTLIIGLTPDNRGLIPEADTKRLQEWGEAIKKEYGNPITEWKSVKNNYTLNVDEEIKEVVLQEKIAEGERVKSFIIEAFIGHKWVRVDQGSCIGHKYIHVFDKPLACKKIRLKIVESNGDPLIKSFSCY
ncbi:MAG: alpha-L-fucosidase [Bacteroidetes bacterium]|nr:alpha-L-fucosidase [Bacteroidota bacterium]